MKKKNTFTMIELIAGLVILSMLVIILIPVVSSHNENTKKEKYIKDVNDIVAKAEKLRNNKDYVKLFEKSGNNYYITLDKISNVPLKDPYGYIYDKKESKITFKGENTVINIKSCKQVNDLLQCYEIVDVNKKELNTDSIIKTLD